MARLLVKSNASVGIWNNNSALFYLLVNIVLSIILTLKYSVNATSELARPLIVLVFYLFYF